MKGRWWCPTCREDATPSPAGLCMWCDGPLVRRRGGGKPVGRHGYLTDAQLRAAHVLYERGLSVRRVAERIHPRTRYASVSSCSMALIEGWRRLGLPRRDRIEAAVAASTVHGKASRGRVDRAHIHELRVARGEILDVRCEGVLASGARRGAPCSRPALAGERFCLVHHPARGAEAAEHLARGRALKVARA